MVEDKFEWWYESRARARAILLLTERDDFEMAEGSGPWEMDLYVCPKPVQPAHSNILGIQIMGHRKLPESVAKQMSASALDEFDPSQWPHPSCLFLFEADGEKAFYQWLAEPVSNGHNSLVKPDAPSPRKLDASVVSEMFDRLRQWYGSAAAEKAA